MSSRIIMMVCVKYAWWSVLKESKFILEYICFVFTHPVIVIEDGEIQENEDTLTEQEP